MIPLAPWLQSRALSLGGRIVPAAQRRDWQRTWQAELSYAHSRGHHDLTGGLLQDACWLRGEGWRRALDGTPRLCLLLLSTLAVLAALPLLIATLDGTAPAGFVAHLLPRFTVAACLTLVVSHATSFVPIAASGGGGRRWVRASLFHAAKALLLLLLAALVSTDLCLPLELCRCFAAVPLELLLFVTFALFGLRWNHLDGQTRCKACLVSLAAPERIGRPSWNFLDYNGTQLACRAGHGHLTVPELETSWCRSSAWVAR